MAAREKVALVEGMNPQWGDLPLDGTATSNKAISVLNGDMVEAVKAPRYAALQARRVSPWWACTA